MPNPNHAVRRVAALFACAFLVAATSPGGGASTLRAAGDAPAAPNAATAAPQGPKNAAELALEQRRIAEKFKRFEQVIKLLAQFSDEGGEDQVRLLRQVFAESQSRSIDGKFEELVKLLGSSQLGLAAENQEQMTGQLEELLAMLLAAERGKELKAEQERIKDYVKKIKELINKQLEVQGRTASGDLPGAAPEQGKIAADADALAKRMEAAARKPGDGKSPPKPGDSKPGDAKPGDAKPGEAKPGDAKPGESKPSDAKPSDAKPGDAKPGDAKPGESKPGESGDSDQSSPTESPQRRVAAAQQKMEDARKKLEEAKKDGALEDQDAALRELEQAKAELEEILRQLREEELARLLDMLEKRFTEMLRLQEAVYRDTQGLHAVPVAARGQAEQIESGRLSREEGVILVAADKALSVLKEEGSAVAFPRTVEQLRDDVSQIVELLAATKVDELTLAVEEDVIATLKELIEALQKAKKDLKNKEKSRQPGEGQPGEQPLIDRIAELKMIRTLQVRVNRRTKVVSETADLANDPQAVAMIRKLAATEREVFQITRDIVLGRNK